MVRRTIGKNVRSRRFSFVEGKSRENIDLFSWRGLLRCWPVIPMFSLIVICVLWRQSDAYVDQYTLKAIEVVGLQMLTGRGILEITDLVVGDNLVDIDMTLVAQQLEDHPWIKHAVIRRKPPDRLIVEIVERRRLAWIKIGKTFGIDFDGVLLPESILPREAVSIGHLPLIRLDKLVPDSLDVGSNLGKQDDRVRKILDWWTKAKNADPEFCAGVIEVGLLEDGAVVFWLAGDRLEVRLPHDGPSQRLMNLKLMMPKIYLENPDPRYVDLRYDGQVVVGGKEGLESK
ncbi:MAG: FtsQ-type POTRA domain-containing protein [Candidatus Latescibacterota bacterium]|nr:FtsQ-type POTRA domain-containing protein [Candidatus Latescibacterota bacterium]